jgi:S-adenosylmethionine decarboxylase
VDGKKQIVLAVYLSAMTKEDYQKGLHLIVDLDFCTQGCADMAGFRTLVMGEINALELHVLGTVFHAFENGAFTAVICLTESHLSVHTWPEFQRVTFDVFLSNYQHVNNAKARRLSDCMKAFFSGVVTQEKEVHR